jgi:hypothetical protein
MNLSEESLTTSRDGEEWMRHPEIGNGFLSRGK